jgi:hypothetical protein
VTTRFTAKRASRRHIGSSCLRWSSAAPALGRFIALREEVGSAEMHAHHVIRIVSWQIAPVDLPHSPFGSREHRARSHGAINCPSRGAFAGRDLHDEPLGRRKLAKCRRYLLRDIPARVSASRTGRQPNGCSRPKEESATIRCRRRSQRRSDIESRMSAATIERGVK